MSLEKMEKCFLKENLENILMGIRFCILFSINFKISRNEIDQEREIKKIAKNNRQNWAMMV